MTFRRRTGVTLPALRDQRKQDFESSEAEIDTLARIIHEEVN